MRMLPRPTGIARHVPTMRLMSYMVFPDNPDLRTASEVTFRTKLADWGFRAILPNVQKTTDWMVEGRRFEPSGLFKLRLCRDLKAFVILRR